MGSERGRAVLAGVVLVLWSCAGAPGPQPRQATACTSNLTAGEDSLAGAVPQAGPGDVLCLHGTFDERLIVVSSGTADAPITFRSGDPAEPAVLQPADGVDEGDQGVVELRDVAHVRIEGLELTGWRTDQLGHVPAGIVVASSGRTDVDGVELVDNHVHDLGHTHPASFTPDELADCDGSTQDCAEERKFSIQAFGIVVKGRADTPITNLSIEGNQLHDLTLGGSEALAINGNIDGFEVVDNVVHDVNNIAIDAIGYEDLDGYPAGVAMDDTVARNGRIAGNRVWNVTSVGNPAYGDYGDDGAATSFDQSAVGVYVDGGRDIVVERNTIVSADLGIEVAAEFDFGTTRDNVVRNNVVAAFDFAGIAVGGYAVENDDDGLSIDEAYNGEGDATGTQIVHNTVHADDREGAALVAQHRVTDTVVAGNLLLAGEGQIVAGAEDDAFDGVELFGNLERTVTGEQDPDGLFGDASPPTPAALAAGGDTLRQFLHLTDGSPAIDAGATSTDTGTALRVGEADVDGDVRQDGAIDLGADELTGDSPATGVSTGRLSGPNRFATAVAIAQTDHPRGADVVVLARADEFADALASTPVAVAEQAPVLVSESDELNAETAVAIEALDPATVILFGGTAALSAEVGTALAAQREVVRIAGSNRYETAADAAEYLADGHGPGEDGDGDLVAIVAEAGDPRGPLAAGVPAAAGRLPVLLTDDDRLPPETRAALTGLGIDEVELIGNTTQISDGVRMAIEDLGITVNRVEGPTPLDTVAAVARMGAARGLLDGQGAVLARGDHVVDALGAGPHATARGVPILLAESPTMLGAAARGWFADPVSGAAGLIEAVGGTAAVSDAVVQEAADTVSTTPWRNDVPDLPRRRVALDHRHDHLRNPPR